MSQHEGADDCGVLAASVGEASSHVVGAKDEPFSFGVSQQKQAAHQHESPLAKAIAVIGPSGIRSTMNGMGGGRNCGA
jgi:hypothetical protein